LRQRSLEARRAKARRGELLVMAPVGYRKNEEQRLEKDPDRRVQEVIRLVFDQFELLGSVRQTLLWFHEHDLQLPAVSARAELRWKRPIYGTLYQMLTNPVYGVPTPMARPNTARRYVEGVARKSARRRPREQWLALIPNAHEGYVSWERFERLQSVIHSNDTRSGGRAGARAPARRCSLDCYAVGVAHRS